MLMSPVFGAAVQYCLPESRGVGEGGVILCPSLHLLLYYGYHLSFSEGQQKKKDNKYMKDVSGEKSPLVYTLQVVSCTGDEKERDNNKKKNNVASDFFTP